MKSLFSVFFSLLLFFGVCINFVFAETETSSIKSDLLLKDFVTDKANILDTFQKRALSEELFKLMKILTGSKVYFYTKSQLEFDEDSFLTELFAVNQLGELDILLVFFYEKTNNLASFKSPRRDCKS